MKASKHSTAVFAAIIALSAATPSLAQRMPDIGFESVGRGHPLAADVRESEAVGPNWIREFGAPQEGEPKVNGYRPEDLPADIEPLAVDIFTTDDFYADVELDRKSVV